MKMPREDMLNALLTDLLADQVLRAMELGYTRREVEDAVRIGLAHGTEEHVGRRRELEETRRFLEGS